MTCPASFAWILCAHALQARLFTGTLCCCVAADVLALVRLSSSRSCFVRCSVRSILVFRLGRRLIGTLGKSTVVVFCTHGACSLVANFHAIVATLGAWFFMYYEVSPTPLPLVTCSSTLLMLFVRPSSWCAAHLSTHLSAGHAAISSTTSS